MFSIASTYLNKAVLVLTFNSRKNESFYRLIIVVLEGNVSCVQPIQFKMLLIEICVSKTIFPNDFSITFLVELLLIKQV